MKNTILEPRPEADILESVSIQGLFSPIKAHENFWFLKAKIELSIFQETEKRGKTKHEKT